MSGSLSTETNAEPNLTPMLDMVFQLVTFFMLMMNFKSAEIDRTLTLPVVGSAHMVATRADTELIVLNLDAQGRLQAYGRRQVDIEDFLRSEALRSAASARGSAAAARHSQRGASGGAAADLPSIVVIRADEATPFKLLNRLIKACQDNGFANFSLKTAIKREKASTKRARHA